MNTFEASEHEFKAASARALGADTVGATKHGAAVMLSFTGAADVTKFIDVFLDRVPAEEFHKELGSRLFGEASASADEPAYNLVDTLNGWRSRWMKSDAVDSVPSAAIHIAGVSVTAIGALFAFGLGTGLVAIGFGVMWYATVRTFKRG